MWRFDLLGRAAHSLFVRTTGRYARFFAVGVERGYTPLCPASFVRFKNGGIPTIRNLEVGVVRVRVDPNWEIRLYLEVVAGRGCVPSCSTFPIRFGNGHFSTIHDLRAGVVCVRSGPNRGDVPVSRGWGRRRGSALWIFTQCARGLFAVCGAKRRECGFLTGRADFQPAVWIPAMPCGFRAAG